MRTVVVLLAMAAIAEAHPRTLTHAEVRLSRVEYSSGGPDDNPQLQNRRSGFMSCYQRVLGGARPIALRYQVGLPITPGGIAGTPRVAAATGEVLRLSDADAIRSCLVEQLRKLRFAPGPQREARFSIAFVPVP